MAAARLAFGSPARSVGAPTVLLAAVAWGDDGGGSLARLLDSMSSFRADFEQVVNSAVGEVLQTSTGTMHLELPGRLRWEVDDPYPQLVVGDGEYVWIYDPDLEQVTVQPFAETIEGTPAMVLADSATLERNFRVRTERPAQGDGRRFVLSPRNPDASSLFRTVILSFAENGVLAEIHVVDHLEQATRISFRDAELNPVLESDLFKFELPEGVDVIGSLPDDLRGESSP